MCTLTVQVSIKVHIGVVLHTWLYGTSQFLLLHLAVEGAVRPVGEGGHAGLHAAAGPPGVRPPSLVLHHQQPWVRTPVWDDAKREREREWQGITTTTKKSNVPFVRPYLSLYVPSLWNAVLIHISIFRGKTHLIQFKCNLCVSLKHKINWRVSFYNSIQVLCLVVYSVYEQLNNTVKILKQLPPFIFTVRKPRQM